MAGEWFSGFHSLAIHSSADSSELNSVVFREAHKLDLSVT